MSFIVILLWIAVLAAAAKTVAWLIQRRSGNAGIVDAIWAWTLGGSALVWACAGTGDPFLRGMMAVMGVAWGGRLGWHLWQRNHGQPEDWRYAQLRTRWGRRADRNMFWFFQFQVLFTLALSASAFAPVAYAAVSPGPVWIGFALAIWFTAVFGKSLADRQLRRFRADPDRHGQVCRDGLWRYSRHPNYFFECLHWCAYVPLAVGGAGWPWTLAAPAIMAFLLLRLSGVPLLEAEMIRRKPGYADYVRQTNVLVPWWPRGNSAPYPASGCDNPPHTKQ